MVKYGEEYKLDKSISFLIYGAATTGAIVYTKLKEMGVNILAFADKRADETESYYGLPVWGMDEVGTYKDKEKVCIFIAIKNVFEHEKVAMELRQRGYQKIVFRPYQVVTDIGNENDKCLNNAYDSVLCGNIPAVCKIILDFDMHVLKDSAVISDLGDYVIANIPIQYIFTDMSKGVNSIWSDIPCLGMLAHIGLFEMLNGTKNDDWSEYIKYCKTAAQKNGGIVMSQEWEKNVYQNRIDVFNHMQYSWEHDKDFFVRNAVEGEYNSGGYFNIRSGKHRNVFQIVKGSRYIPLKVKKDDYSVWSDKGKAERIVNYLQKIHCNTLPLILCNPYLYDFPTSTTAFYEKAINGFIKEIYRWYYYNQGDFDFTNKRILFYNTPLALYANLFVAIRFNVSIFEVNEHRRNVNNLFLGNVNYNEISDNSIVHSNYWDLIVVENEISESINAKFTLKISDSLEREKKLIAASMAENRMLFATLEYI